LEKQEKLARIAARRLKRQEKLKLEEEEKQNRAQEKK
jgi:hypothetical protein